MVSNEHFFPPFLLHKKNKPLIHDQILPRRNLLLQAEDLDDNSISTDTIPNYLKSIEDTSEGHSCNADKSVMSVRKSLVTYHITQQLLGSLKNMDTTIHDPLCDCHNCMQVKSSISNPLELTDIELINYHPLQDSISNPPQMD